MGGSDHGHKQIQPQCGILDAVTNRCRPLAELPNASQNGPYRFDFEVVPGGGG